MPPNKGNLLKAGTVYWITGLSGSGKTTLSKKLTKYLFKSGKKVIKLDGDELREVLDKKYSHTRNERLKIAMTYARLVKMLSNQGYDVVIATISLFREVHKWNKLKNKNLVNIFLDVPIEELKKRDPKKIYKNSQKNKMIAGISFKVDIPLDPNVHILWKNGMNENILFQNVLKQLNLKKKK
jgi:adenylylsulfate kinase-like enzyme